MFPFAGGDGCKGGFFYAGQALQNSYGFLRALFRIGLVRQCKAWWLEQFNQVAAARSVKKANRLGLLLFPCQGRFRLDVMDLPFFLYRRFSRWITCKFRLQDDAQISLSNKYEIASFKDVFCHPFYWQVFQWVTTPPRLVVDCGAHCGHFSVLADLCFQSKFGSSEAQYLLIEPNPYLLPIIDKTIIEAGLSQRTQVKQGLLGHQSGHDTLWINHKNYLATGLYASKGAQPFEVPYLSLADMVGDQTIDLLKIDIEGGEFEFIQSHADLLQQVNLIVMELHTAPEEKHRQLLETINTAGLRPSMPPIQANGQQLLVFQREQALSKV